MAISLVVVLGFLAFSGLASGSALKSVPAKQEVEEIGGFIVFRRLEGGQLQYLLLEKDDEPGDWSPPKGHIEGNEIPVNAAIRETREETGLLPAHYKPLYGLEEYFEYETNKDVLKKVTLWPAELIDVNRPIVISPESRDYKWADTTQTLSIIKKQYKQAFVNLLALLECELNLSSC